MSDPTIPDQLDTIAGQFSAGNDRMKRIEEGQVLHDRRLKRMEDGLLENTAATARVEKNTAEMVAFFESVQGAFRLFDMLGKLAKPVGYIAAAVAAIGGAWIAIKGGRP